MHESIGKSFTDSITGFKGVCTGRIEYITGCNQLLLTPKVGEDGVLKDGAWFDEQRCQGYPTFGVGTSVEQTCSQIALQG